MGHHAFNSPDHDIYWKEEAIGYCYEYFTKTLSIDPMSIIFREDPWVGGGNAGPALEILVGGLELATLVFMNMKKDKKGAVELKGVRYSPMDMRVVDPGYGLERLVWASKTPRVTARPTRPQLRSPSSISSIQL